MYGALHQSLCRLRRLRHRQYAASWTRLLSGQGRKICHGYEAELELFALIRAISYAQPNAMAAFTLKFIRRGNCMFSVGQTCVTCCVFRSEQMVTDMALSEARTAVVEAPTEDPAAPRTQLGQAISDCAASYTGPIETEAGKALWAIQAWYAELGDEVRAEALLCEVTQTAVGRSRSPIIQSAGHP